MDFFSRSGPQADTYRLVASAPGVKNDFFGGGGNDMMLMGAAPGAGLAAKGGDVGPAVAAGMVLDGIHGETLFDGEDGSDFVTLDDSGNTTGKTAHLTVAWRLKPGEAAPVRVELGSAELDLP